MFLRSFAYISLLVASHVVVPTQANGLCCTIRQGVKVCGAQYCPDRRRLEEAAKEKIVVKSGADATNHAMYQDFATKCGKYDYEAKLFVDHHFYAMAFPKDDAAAAGCPHLTTHAITSEDGPYTIEALTSDEAMFPKEDSFHMGTFKGLDLLGAIDQVDPSHSTIEHGGYEIIKNNCANYLISLASALEVKVDSHVIGYVTRRLVEESGKDLADGIRQSINFPSIFHGRGLRSAKGASDEEVIKATVEMRAAELV